MSLKQKTRLVEVSTNAQGLSSVTLPPSSGKTPAQSRTGSPVSSLVRRAGRTRTRTVLFDIPQSVGKFDLIRACTALQIEFAGCTQAQLRARINNHINSNYKLEHYLMHDLRQWWLTQNPSDPKISKREWVLPGASEKILFQGVRGRERPLDKPGPGSSSTSVAINKKYELAPPDNNLDLAEEAFERLVLLDDDDEEEALDAVTSSDVVESTKLLPEVDNDNTIILGRHGDSDSTSGGSPSETIRLTWDTLRTGEDTFNMNGLVKPINTSNTELPRNGQRLPPVFSQENEFTNSLPTYATGDASVSWKEFEQHRQAHMAEMNELTLMLKVLADEMRDIDDVLLEQSAEILHNKAEISHLEMIANSACSQSADQRNILFTAAQQIEQFQRESMQYRNIKQPAPFVSRPGVNKPQFGRPIYTTPAAAPFHSENFIQLRARFMGLQRTTADALETVKRNHKRLNVTIAGIQMTDGVSATEDAEAILNRLNFHPGSPYAAWRRYGEREDGVPFDPSQPPFLIIRFNSEFIVMDLLKTFNAFRNRFPDRKAPFKIMKDLTKNQVLEAKKVNEIILKWRKTDGKDYRNRDGVIYLFENGVRIRKIGPGEGPHQFNPLSTTHQPYFNKQYSSAPQGRSPGLLPPPPTHPGSFARALPPTHAMQNNNQPTMKRYEPVTYDHGNARSSPRPNINFNQPSPVSGLAGYNQSSPQGPQRTQQRADAGYQHHLRQPYGVWYPPAAALSQGGYR